MRLHGNTVCCSPFQARFMIPLEVHDIDGYLSATHTGSFYSPQRQAFPASNSSLSNLWVNHTPFYYLTSSGAKVYVWPEGSHPSVPSWSDNFKWLQSKWLLPPPAHLEGEVVKRRDCVPFPLHQHPQMLHVGSGPSENSTGCAVLPARCQQDPHHYVWNCYVIRKICRILFFFFLVALMPSAPL